MAAVEKDTQEGVSAPATTGEEPVSEERKHVENGPSTNVEKTDEGAKVEASGTEAAAEEPSGGKQVEESKDDEKVDATPDEKRDENADKKADEQSAEESDKLQQAPAAASAAEAPAASAVSVAVAAAATAAEKVGKAAGATADGGTAKTSKLGVVSAQHRDGKHIAWNVLFPGTKQKDKLVSVDPSEYDLAMELLSYCRANSGKPREDLKAWCCLTIGESVEKSTKPVQSPDPPVASESLAKSSTDKEKKASKATASTSSSSAAAGSGETVAQADLEMDEESRMFTPTRINPELCYGRTWAGGQGGQCIRRPELGERLCTQHKMQELSPKGLVHGFVDGPIPKKKLEEFKRSVTGNIDRLVIKAEKASSPDAPASEAKPDTSEPKSEQEPASSSASSSKREKAASRKDGAAGSASSSSTAAASQPEEKKKSKKREAEEPVLPAPSTSSSAPAPSAGAKKPRVENGSRRRQLLASLEALGAPMKKRALQQRSRSRVLPAVSAPGGAAESAPRGLAKSYDGFSAAVDKACSELGEDLAPAALRRLLDDNGAIQVGKMSDVVALMGNLAGDDISGQLALLKAVRKSPLDERSKFTTTGGVHAMHSWLRAALVPRKDDSGKGRDSVVLEGLKCLQALPISTPTLKDTGIGVTVNRLRIRCPEPAAADKAAELMVAWLADAREWKNQLSQGRGDRPPARDVRPQTPEVEAPEDSGMDESPAQSLESAESDDDAAVGGDDAAVVSDGEDDPEVVKEKIVDDPEQEAAVNNILAELLNIGKALQGDTAEMVQENAENARKAAEAREVQRQLRKARRDAMRVASERLAATKLAQSPDLSSSHASSSTSGPTDESASSAAPVSSSSSAAAAPSSTAAPASAGMPSADGNVAEGSPEEEDDDEDELQNCLAEVEASLLACLDDDEEEGEEEDELEDVDEAEGAETTGPAAPAAPAGGQDID
eukprot:TRINITY_DN341_c5_g1_i1.p1 TRINITY_DN341_c5_g1~~TRINITY_DN341_c5_g1_i1.p1  ORF type:complete len:951 (+),score=297.00 TRINITY_DN341_c5_g1_i1:102-2954(+)